MGDLERIEAKLDWCVSALKYLLSQQVTDGSDEWIATAQPEFFEAVEAEEYIVPIHAPKVPKPKPCPHNQQVLVDGNVQCARCGFVLSANAGVTQDRVASNGQIIRDPNPNARRAGQDTHEASSKNPGTPLVPHMS